MSPGDRVAYSRRWLRSQSRADRLSLNSALGTLVSVDDDGYARVRWDNDPKVWFVLIENLTEAAQKHVCSWRPSALWARADQLGR